MKAIYHDSWRVVGCAAALAIGAVGAWEWHLRDNGYPVNFVNLHDECRQRQWDALEPDSVVVLGASEAMADIDLDVLGQQLHKPVHSLARFGTPPDLGLEVLARRQDFRGIAIASFTPGYFRSRWATSALAVGVPVLAPEDPSHAGRAHTALSFHANRHLHFRSRTFVLSSIVDRVLNGEWRADWQSMNERLEWLIDFSDGEHARRDRETVLGQLNKVGPPLTEAELTGAINRLKPAVEALQRRGATVIFVTLPVGKAVRELTSVPREQGWERLCRESGARCIHADDHESLERWEPHDEIHLDKVQRTQFTVAFSQTVCEVIRCAR